jgi:anti-sigma factor RsiW
VTGQPNDISAAELHAFVDGTLAEDRRAAVEAHLAATPEDAQRVADYQRLNAELHAVYDPALDRPVPVEFTRPVRRLWGDRRAGQTLAVLAASIVLFVVGVASGWFARDAASPAAAAHAPIVYYAARAHDVYSREVRHAVEVPANEEDHLVRWLSKRMGGEIKAPRLSEMGYRLMGGRLLPSGTTVAAQFMYEDTSGARLTLYVKSGMEKNRETAFRFDEYDGVAVFYWIDGPFGYALAGQAPRESLLYAAKLVYDQIAR